MKYRGMKNWLKKSVAAYLATGFIAIVPSVGNAAPAEGQLPVYDGTAPGYVATEGTTMNITGTDPNNVLTWKDFSIGEKATVQFNDKNYLNLVTGNNLSEIYGTMKGTGDIYLINPNGIIFGKDAQVNVGSLHLSTRAVDGNDFATYVNEGALVATDALKGNIVNVGSVTANKLVMEGINVSFLNDKNLTIGGKSWPSGYGEDPDVNAANTRDASLVQVKATNEVHAGYLPWTEAHQYDWSWIGNGKSGFTVNDEATVIGYTAITNLDGDIANFEKGNYNKTPAGNLMLICNTTANKTIFTGKDIDYKSDDKNVIEGGAGKKSVFSGRFDGLGFTISGLKTEDGAAENVGLFGITNGATIENVKLDNFELTGKTNVGALVGKIEGATTIKNVELGSGKITGDKGTNIGGLVGYVANGSNISNVINKGIEINYTSSTGWDDGGPSTGIGGIAGNVDQGASDSDKDTVISYVVNEAAVTGGVSVGGIAGILKGTVDHALNVANVAAKIGTDGGNNAGGIAGQLYGTISSSINSGDITGGKAGGIAGTGGWFTIKDSYHTGNVDGYNHLGGIVGAVDGSVSTSDTKLDKTYNLGAVAANSDQCQDDKSQYCWADGHVGSLVGENAAKVDVSTSAFVNTKEDGSAVNVPKTGEGINPAYYNKVGTGKSYEEMADQRTAADKLAADIRAAFTSGGTGGGDDVVIPEEPSIDTGATQFLPTGMQSSTVTVDDVTTNKNLMTITKDGNNVINWEVFSVGKNNKVEFKGGNFLNIVTGANTSEIYGVMTAEGSLYILNPYGVVFGDGAYVNVAGELAVSTRSAEIKGFDGSNPFGAEADVAVNGNIVVLSADVISGSTLTLEGNNVTIKDVKGHTFVKGTAVRAKGYAHFGNNKGVKATDLSGEGDNKGIDYKLITDVKGLPSMSGNFMLANSVEVGEHDFGGRASDWGVNFTGNFDGLGYEIKGLKVTEDANNRGPVGLFSQVSNSTIENVVLTDVDIQAAGWIPGGIAGSISDTTIRNCYVSGSIKNSSDGGAGIVGAASGNSVIENCYNHANVDVAKWGGSGIVTQLLTGSKLINCYNDGNVTGGGVAAGISAQVSGYVENVYNAGIVVGDDGSTGMVAKFEDDNGNTGDSKNILDVSALTDAEKHSASTYAGFTIANSATESAPWRIVEGYTMPMLTSLFKGTATSYGTLSGLTYNGEEQKASSGEVTFGVADLDLNSPSVYFMGHKDAGSYSGGKNMYSSQLGYNLLDATTMIIDKKTLHISDVNKVSDHTVNVAGTEFVFKDDAGNNGVVAGDNVYLDMSKTQAVVNTDPAGSVPEINADVHFNKLEETPDYTVTYSNAILAGSDAKNYQLAEDSLSGTVNALISEKNDPMEYLPAGEVSEAYNSIGSMQAEANSGEEPAVVVISTSSAATVAGEASTVSVENGEAMKVDPKQSVHDNRNGEKNGKEKKNKK